jgi:hypothetical protein
MVPTDEMVKAAVQITGDGFDITRRALAAALAASTPVGGWEDISTAPKDGSEIIAYSQDVSGTTGLNPFVSLCAWHPDAGFCTCELREVTHWMRFDPPPVSTGSRPREAVPTEPVTDRWADLERLALAAAKRATVLWGSDIEKSEGEYGVGDECHSGFMVPYMETEHGKRLFDAHYCDVAEVHVEYDEDGAHAWDEAAREIFNYLAAVQPSAVLELIAAARPQPAEGCSSNEGAA